MRKKWSSTRSGDGKTKRQASKEARHYCRLCGLEDGACICRWLPGEPPEPGCVFDGETWKHG